MSSVNRVILLGNLGKDPEVKHGENGTLRVSFSLATNDYYKNKNKENVSRVDWHNVVLWGRLAELGEKYLRKGKQVYIEGKLTTKSFEGKNGDIKYITEVVANSMILLGGPRVGVSDGRNAVQGFDDYYMF